MTGRELLALARDLLARAEPPPAGTTAATVYRAAVGRPYYATFTAAVAFLDRIGFEMRNSSTAHSQLQHAFNNSGSDVLVRLAETLRTLSTERRRADYVPKDHQIGTRRAAETAIGNADAALTALEGVPTEQLGAIASAVLAWVTSSQSDTIVRKSAKA